MLQILLTFVFALAASDVPPRFYRNAEPPAASTLGETRGFVNAGQVKGLCAAAENAGDGQFEMCLGYLAGSIDQLVAQDRISGVSARDLCPNTALSLDHFRQAFLDYMEVNPQVEKAAAAAVIERAATPSLKCNMFAGRTQ